VTLSLTTIALYSGVPRT